MPVLPNIKGRPRRGVAHRRPHHNSLLGLAPVPVQQAPGSVQILDNPARFRQGHLLGVGLCYLLPARLVPPPFLLARALLLHRIRHRMAQYFTLVFHRLDRLYMLWMLTRVNLPAPWWQLRHFLRWIRFLVFP